MKEERKALELPRLLLITELLLSSIMHIIMILLMYSIIIAFLIKTSRNAIRKKLWQ